MTDAGIQYLRDFLHLPAEIVPATFKKSNKPLTRPSASSGPQRRGDDGEYRRRPAPFGEKKEGAAPGGFRPEFVSDLVVLVDIMSIDYLPLLSSV